MFPRLLTGNRQGMWVMKKQGLNRWCLLGVSLAVAISSHSVLAGEAAQLEQFYAQPMCTPTRAALMTGRYPFRYGLQTLVIPSAMTYGMPTDERTLPQALKEAGYRTVMIGK